MHKVNWANVIWYLHFLETKDALVDCGIPYLHSLCKKFQLGDNCKIVLLSFGHFGEYSIPVAVSTHYLPDILRSQKATTQK